MSMAAADLTVGVIVMPISAAYAMMGKAELAGALCVGVCVRVSECGRWCVGGARVKKDGSGAGR